MSVFKNYSGIKIVGTVRGNWTATVAKSATAAVLPNLPKIDAVVDEGGGDSYGLAEAFADSNRPMPIVFGDNSGPFLIWWAQQAQKNGYETMGQASVPAVGSAAFYVAIAVLQGKKVPKSMDMPFLTFTNSTLKDWSNVQMNGMADPQYDYDWVQANLLNQ
jgi:ribose transport system substrate-binding protein